MGLTCDRVARSVRFDTSVGQARRFPTILIDMISYWADGIGVRGERSAVLRRATSNACAFSRLSARRFTRRRAVDFKRDGAMRCR